MNNAYRYELKPRDPSLGGGWNLKLYDADGEEAGGAVYPLVPDPEANPEQGIEWWNAMEEASRREWMRAAGDTGRVVDAYRAYLTQLARDEAESQGEWWISSRGDAAK